MDGETILDHVTTAMDAVIDATEAHGGPYMFSSVLDRETGTVPDDLPPPIDHGHRVQDRAYPGANLMHDVDLLRAMFGLAQAAEADRLGAGTTDLPSTDRGYRRYETAALQYLDYFATYCVDTKTGLFPWGEHAFWHLELDRPAGGRALGEDQSRERPVHDHLRQAPRWLLEHLGELNPDCLQDFADGLDYHWKLDTPAGVEYNRHAWMLTTKRYGNTGYNRSDDFPRHGGYYLVDWAMAYRGEHRERTFRQLSRMADYWWQKRDPAERGLLPSESRGDSDHSKVLSPAQTTELAVTCIDAAVLLAEDAPRLADRLRERGETYAEGVLHSIDTPREDGEIPRGDPGPIPADTTYTPPEGGLPDSWVSGYDTGVSLPFGNGSLLRIYRHTGDERFLDYVRGVGETLVGASLPDEPRIRAGTAANALSDLADLHAITGEQRWLAAGVEFADEVVPGYFDGAALPRAATGIDHYEAQAGTGRLVGALTGLALLDTVGEDSPMPHADLVEDTLGYDDLRYGG